MDEDMRQRLRDLGYLAWGVCCGKRQRWPWTARGYPSKVDILRKKCSS